MTATIDETTRLDAVLARLRPVFARIAEGTLDRETSRTLPREQVRWLVEAGFPGLRVPAEYGGDGLTLPELAQVLVELAAADSNLPQIFRGHLALVEDRLVAPEGPQREAWLRRFAAGEFAGNAWSETGSGALGVAGTRISRSGDGWVVNGRKYYTTGSIYADWMDVTVQDETGADYVAIVRTVQPGVRISDDWDGFGQQLTGTGTAVFTDAAVEELIPFGDRFRYQTALYQLVLLSVHAGIARAAGHQLSVEVQRRDRVYSHGAASVVRQDPQVLQAVGEVTSAAYVAEAAVLRVAQALQRAFETAPERDSEADRAANVAAELESAQAQVVLSELVPRAATRIFDALGASATGRAKALDRHWRNARTVASHNPWIYKARIVGDWAVNGTEPPFIWNIGIDAKGEVGR